MLNRVSAVIVTYNPDLLNLNRLIKSIISQVFEVIIVDNSEKTIDLSDYSSNSNVKVISFSNNLGIAFALNTGFKQAINDGANWIISFDQDSIPPNDIVSRLIAQISNSLYDIDLIAPCYYIKGNDYIFLDKCIPVKEVITSGSMVRASAYKAVGGFKDELFIDSVDTEFSWNLLTHGFSVYMYQGIELKHQLGTNSRNINLFGLRIMTITNHNHIRYYYMTRNAYYVSNMYKNELGFHAINYRYKGIKILIKVLLFEKDKFRKCRYIIKGYKDFKNKIMGKYNG